LTRYDLRRLEDQGRVREFSIAHVNRGESSVHVKSPAVPPGW